MRRIPIFHVDAFTESEPDVRLSEPDWRLSEPDWRLSDGSHGSYFTGNPAAVCLLEAAAESAWMQGVANEMNLSETAFIHRENEEFRLRWFTPKMEVPLCGHATLAAAHVLWETGVLAGHSPARFFTLSGELVAHRRDPWIELNFPSKPVHEVAPKPGLVVALGVSPQFVGSDGDNDLVQVATETEVKNAVPDFALLKAACPFGVILTAPSSHASCDFVSRYFAPSLGIDEDPVTGSSHCALGPFWQARLKRDIFVGRQVSQRGGVVKVEVLEGRILLGGKAATRGTSTVEGTTR